MVVHLVRQIWTLRMLKGRQHSGPSRTLYSGYCTINKILVILLHLHLKLVQYRLCRLGCPSVDIVGSSLPSPRIPGSQKILHWLSKLSLYRDTTCHIPVLKVRLWPRSWRFPYCWSRTSKRRRAGAQGCRFLPPGKAATLGSKTGEH